MSDSEDFSDVDSEVHNLHENYYHVDSESADDFYCYESGKDDSDDDELYVTRLCAQLRTATILQFYLKTPVSILNRMCQIPVA
jgi:hypothetical protein